uniref:DRBM domain-containing protein n=1 Tax=Ditylenchus dipsaci TaxID=166011 RepID=A0A915DYP3_9BILA
MGTAVNDPNMFVTEQVPYQSSHRPFMAPTLTTHDRYVGQKAEEISMSESVDLTSDIHGGWTMENCISALNEFMQKNRQPVANFVINSTGEEHARTFVAACSIFVPQLKKTISARNPGVTKKSAKALCALSLVRQLFHMGIMHASGQKVKKPTASTLPEIKVKVEDSLAIRLEGYLTGCGVLPVKEVKSAQPENPVSLVINQQLEKFPLAESYQAGSISWSPSQQNWNPWYGNNIDEKPLAFMSLEEISKDLLMREKAKEITPEMTATRKGLPVFQHAAEILAAVKNNPVVLIKGATVTYSKVVEPFSIASSLNLGGSAQFRWLKGLPLREQNSLATVLDLAFALKVCLLVHTVLLCL